MKSSLFVIIFIVVMFLGTILTATSSGWSAPIGPVVQDTTCSLDWHSGGDRVTCAYPSNPVTGDVMIVGIVTQNDTSPSCPTQSPPYCNVQISDSNGLTWTRLGSTSFAPDNNFSLSVNIIIWAARATTGAETITLTSTSAACNVNNCPILIDMLELQSGFSPNALQSNTTSGQSTVTGLLTTARLPNPVQSGSFVYTLAGRAANAQACYEGTGNSGAGNYAYQSHWTPLAGTYDTSVSNCQYYNEVITSTHPELSMLDGFMTGSQPSSNSFSLESNTGIPPQVWYADVTVEVQGPAVQLTNVVTTTVGQNLAGQTQVNTYGPVAPFNINNISTWHATQYESSLVYLWYNSAPYPVSINGLWIPVWTTGTNGSYFVAGIYETHTLNSPFQLQWSQPVYLQPYEQLQNFSYTPDVQIPANSFYSVAVADINTTLITACEQHQGATIDGQPCNPTVTHNPTSVFLSPAVFMGVSNFQGGYVGAGFINTNVTNQGQSVLPNFYTDSVIISAGTPMPAMYITETDVYTHVVDVTTTNYVIISDYQGAINRFFQSTTALEGLFVVILPLMILVVKVQNPLIVFVFFLVTMFLAGPTGLNIVPFWGLIEILLVFFMVLGRE